MSEWLLSERQKGRDGKDLEKGKILVCYGWECTLVQPLGINCVKVLEKLKIELGYDPAISLLCI